MRKEELTDIQKRALPYALHEMGHYVAACAVGFGTERVSLKILCGGDPLPYEGSAKINLIELLSSIDVIKDYLRRRMIVLHASGNVESIVLEKSGVSLNDEEALKLFQCPPENLKRDKGKIRELMQLNINLLIESGGNIELSNNKLCEIEYENSNQSKN